MLAVALCACGGGTTDWNDRELPARVLTFSGSMYGDWPVASMRFDNQAQWQSTWEEFAAHRGPAPSVDFSSEQVVGVSKGFGSGCDNVRIERVVEERERIRVEHLFRRPPVGCPAAVVTLLAFVAIERIPKPVYYVELSGTSY